MAPIPRPGWQPGRLPEGLRDAAALALIYPRDGVPHLLLTVRAADLPHHGGQISLPGGELEPGESFEDAALREAEEEVGVDPRTIRLLGRLSPMHIPVSGYALHPVVGVADGPGDWAPHAREVARVLEAPLAVLRDPARRRSEPRRHEQRDYDVPFYDVDGEKVWGATAMVLAELLALLDGE
jgi:8-oxo-dGTP pyrophosphatase MutT (NUDIX family)